MVYNCKVNRHFLNQQQEEYAETLATTASEQNFKVVKNSDDFTPDFTYFGIVEDLHMSVRVL